MGGSGSGFTLLKEIQFNIGCLLSMSPPWLNKEPVTANKIIDLTTNK